MDARFYNTEDLDIERLANDLENIYRAQGYQVQQIGNRDQIMVQLKKGSDFEALIGLQAALSVIIQRSAGGILAMIGQQKWIDKAAVGAVGLVAAPVLWPLMITAGAGAIRQASLGNQVLNVVDGLVRQQRPGVMIGPVPVQIMPQIQQQWAPPPPQYLPPPQSVVASLPPPQSMPTKLRCPNCNTPYDAGDTFCSGCGRSLAPQKTFCSNCGAEIKPGVSFCSKCGTSTFQSGQPQAAAPTRVPPTMPPVRPPVPPQERPIQESTPAYTPPAPTQAAFEPTIKQAPQPYVPPTPQEPPVMPKPSVTIIPGKPGQERPVTPPQPHVPVYTPPVQPQAVKPVGQTPAPPAKPIVSRPVSKPAASPDTPWGNLIFSDGNMVTLSGERVLVGRYDHDIGGITPEVDLGNMQGADTVSRAHATLEHIGSAYTLTDLNSTNSTRINGKRLEPDKATPINDGDTLMFGKVTCTFKKM